MNQQLSRTKPTTRVFYHRNTQIPTAKLSAHCLSGCTSPSKSAVSNVTRVTEACPALTAANTLPAETAATKWSVSWIANLHDERLQICLRIWILGHKAGHLKTQRYAKHEQHAFESHPNYLTFTQNNSPGENNHLVEIMQATQKLFNPFQVSLN